MDFKLYPTLFNFKGIYFIFLYTPFLEKNQFSGKIRVTESQIGPN